MKPYTLVCNSKSKKPSVLGRYKTEGAAAKAYEVFRKKNEESRALEKKYPGQGIEDLFCDLKIMGPNERS
jgi:hypothetical protein